MLTQSGYHNQFVYHIDCVDPDNADFRARLQWWGNAKPEGPPILIISHIDELMMPLGQCVGAKTSYANSFHRDGRTVPADTPVINALTNPTDPQSVHSGLVAAGLINAADPLGVTDGTYSYLHQHQRTLGLNSCFTATALDLHGQPVFTINNDAALYELVRNGTLQGPDDHEGISRILNDCAELGDTARLLSPSQHQGHLTIVKAQGSRISSIASMRQSIRQHLDRANERGIGVCVNQDQARVCIHDSSMAAPITLTANEGSAFLELTNDLINATHYDVETVTQALALEYHEAELAQTHALPLEP